MTKARSVSTGAAAKGDLVAGSGTNTSAILGVGTDGQVLTAASGQATGLQWATPVAGSLTLISTTAIGTSGVTLSSIASTYQSLVLYIKDLAVNSSGNAVWLRFNGQTTAGSYDGGYATMSGATLGGNQGTGTFTMFCAPNSSTGNPVNMMLTIPRYSSSDTRKFVTGTGTLNGSSTNIYSTGTCQITAAISSITIGVQTTTITAGTVYLYGVN